MPFGGSRYRKKNKTSAKKYGKKSYKKYKKQQFMDKASKIMVRGVQPYPDRYMCKLKFTRKDLLSSAVTVSRSYRGSGAYDPVIGLTNVYPQGFASLAGMYRKYQVFASKIRVRFLSTGAGTNLGTSGRCVVCPTQQAIGVIDADSLSNYPYAKSVVVGPAGGSTSSTIISYMSQKKIWGLRGSSAADPECSALTSGISGTSPAKDWIWNVMASSVDGSTSLGTIAIYIDITYYIEFYDRINLTASTVDDDDA